MLSLRLQQAQIQKKGMNVLRCALLLLCTRAKGRVCRGVTLCAVRALSAARTLFSFNPFRDFDLRIFNLKISS